MCENLQTTITADKKEIKSDIETNWARGERERERDDKEEEQEEKLL
jgi:hypothetical protein